ncbi:unnamed protein product [Symbiodinium microadriaticum]|nr:unnamed protein product [Symbiodinium microadriaticum]
MRLQQEVVVELLESTTGDELRMTGMKDVLDEGGDFYNLHKLVFHDLDPEYERALRHIQKEGRRMAKQYAPHKAPIKIISDVDDTLYGSALGYHLVWLEALNSLHFTEAAATSPPAAMSAFRKARYWIFLAYRKLTATYSHVYPGVLALFKEITAERTMKQKEKVPKAPRSCLL